MCVYVNNNIHVFSKRRNDLEIPNIECVWIEVFSHGKTHFWLERFTDPHILQQQDSIGLPRDTNAYDILITGDFNLDMTDNRSSKKINDLCQEYNLSQIISEHTHFTENSRSLTDLIMTSNVDDILLSTVTVGEPFFDQNIRYHCPIFCVLNFEKPKI